MRYLGFALYAEGATDYQFLPPVLHRLVDDLCLRLGQEIIEVGDGKADDSHDQSHQQIHPGPPFSGFRFSLCTEVVSLGVVTVRTRQERLSRNLRRLLPATRRIVPPRRARRAPPTSGGKPRER